MTHKRSDEEMAKLQAETYAGMASRGVTGKAADEIWEKLQGFASFGFPESHSVSFAYIVYMSAWLRAHWPTEYLAGLLNAQPMGFYSPNSLVADAGRHGVVVLPPDVNESAFDCAVVPLAAAADDVVTVAGLSWRRGRGLSDDPLRLATAVRLGLRYVRDLGDVEITRIEGARVVGGPFAGVVDLAQRTGLKVEGLEGLAAAGALASLGVERREACGPRGPWPAWARGASPWPKGPRRRAAPMTPAEETRRPVGHRDLGAPPGDLRTGVAGVPGCLPISEVVGGKHGRRVAVGGLITHRQRPMTARGVIFLNLEDETGLLNVVVLPAVWDANREVARRSVGVVLEGVVEYRDGVTNLVARRFSPWPDEVRDVRSQLGVLGEVTRPLGSGIICNIV